jgi:glycosyltransferase involved in cell wall biosynthesis
LKNKIKIYFFHPYSGVGGADLSISRLINGLDKNHFDIDFISINSPKLTNKISKKIKYRKLNSSRTIYSFRKIKQIIKKDQNFDRKIFISNQYFANVLSLFFLKGLENLKIIVFERNHLSELSNYINFRDLFKKIIIKFLVKIYYKKANLIISNSKESANDLEKFVNRKVLSLYNPSFFNLKKKRKKKNFDKIKLINVGRFVEQKNQITILKAIKKSNFKKKFEVTLFGYGKDYLYLKDYIRKNNLENVKLVRNIFDKNEIYLNADLYVGSSLYEGFPNTYVEAASYRIPIISSNFKSGPKEILLNGKAGTFFPIKDSDKLSKLLDDFYLNRNKYLKKEIICSKNLKRFLYQKITKKFNSILKRLN